MSFKIRIEEDKFVGKKTYWGPTLKIGGSILGLLHPPKISIRKLESPNFNGPIIDYTATSETGWMNMDTGYMVILVDDEAIKVSAHENYSNHDVNYDTSYNSSAKKYETNEFHFYTESVYYRIDETILKRITDARKFRLKIYGRNYEREISNPDEFQNYARAFFNRVYDPNAFINEAENFHEGIAPADIRVIIFGLILGIMMIIMVLSISH